MLWAISPFHVKLHVEKQWHTHSFAVDCLLVQSASVSPSVGLPDLSVYRCVRADQMHIRRCFAQPEWHRAPPVGPSLDYQLHFMKMWVQKLRHSICFMNWKVHFHGSLVVLSCTTSSSIMMKGQCGRSLPNANHWVWWLLKARDGASSGGWGLCCLRGR